LGAAAFSSHELSKSEAPFEIERSAVKAGVSAAERQTFTSVGHRGIEPQSTG
jgi:hypothetical protein